MENVAVRAPAHAKLAGHRNVCAGVARALGSAGATVYVTGRSVRGGAPPADGAAGTVQDTADEVAALFSRVQREQGRLDVLVNAAWGGNELPRLQADWGTPSWEVEAAAYWDSMFVAGVRAALVASQHAARLMAAQGSGLIVSVSFGAGGGSSPYLGNLYYDLAKASLNRLAFCLGEELRPMGVASVALSPGHMRTERVLQAYKTDEQHWREVPELAAGSETPEYLGRAVAALAGDAAVLRHSGQVLLVAELARQYGFTDVDGSIPPPFQLPGAE
ncbi:hypothetical protein CHLNCDRAFT_140068 [Chlorella variabilis]|uniref:Uncharacterized protein n=1 Tax=Chlorella variabilis TaxID=554065 RepID=E1ZRI4_CHLVA|nr:hypothetical protein CHLNCDRAFT_140068 [Chlorella variabilis]EFN51575.1 hypothetical protein CHLNCDRAFT_140068 [Chlorella variabilis]|eukprot:XP_005843677.1 hypothetical protein CHLNCDRAFT_140068 [Chlorella variabilis]